MAETWFTPKEWKARLVEFAGRRLLRNVANGQSATYDVSRSEGLVSQEGDAFNTKNMNDLEQRIADGFANAKTNIDELNMDLNAINDNGAIKGIDAREDGVYITYSTGADTVTKKLGRSGTIAGVGGYWMDPPAGEYKEWTTGCVRWDGDNLLVTVEDDYAQGHLTVGAKVGSKSRPSQWGDKTGGLITLKY
jgi:hypothetical protein